MNTVIRNTDGTITVDGVRMAAVDSLPTTIAAPQVVDRSAKSLQPLYKVRYKSRAGNTETYGVFWEGIKNGEHRVGLRKMLQSGLRMSKRTQYNKGFFVAASRTTRLA